MSKNILEVGRIQMTKWCTQIESRIPKAKSTHSEYVIIIVLTLEQWLYQRTSMLRYAYIAYLVYIIISIGLDQPSVII
jgi:hypothetical protein